MNSIKKLIPFAVVLGICVLGLFVLRNDRLVAVDSGHRTVMGTFARVVAVASDEQTAQRSIEAAFKQLHRLDRLMSSYKSDSELTRINRTAGEKPVKISPETFSLLEESGRYWQMTDGAFDITVGPIIDLWHRCADANTLPTKQQITRAKKAAGFEKLILDANAQTVRFTVPGMKIKLGGIAKGYAVDKALEAMKKAGAAGGMVDAGGDIACFGKTANGSKSWIIGLQNPAGARADITDRSLVLSLELNEKQNANAVATSGNYQRFSRIGPKRYSHIINPKTARTADALTSVTIIAPDATSADALATAVSVTGPEKGIKLIESIPDTEAILIGAENPSKLITSCGAEKLIRHAQPDNLK